MNNYVYSGEADRDLEYRKLFVHQKRKIARSLLTDEFIGEHKSRPLGAHSDELERVLLFLRLQPLAGRYAIQVIELFKAYCIIELSGERRLAPRRIDDEVYPSVEAAYHAVFLRRVEDLLRTEQ